MMPYKDRFSYAIRVSVAQFAGFAIGVLIWIGVEALVRPDAFSDAGKFTFGELVTIYALFVLMTGTINAFGAFFGAIIAPAVPTSEWFWFLPVCMGVANASAMLVFTFVSGFDYFSQYGITGIVVAGFLTAPLIRVVGLTFNQARRWFAPGMCQACGYDLRKTPPGGNCPECGEAIPLA